MKVVLQADVQNCFPTTPQQLALDMVDSKAYFDYQSTQYKKGVALPTHPAFLAALPICHLLYGAPSRLTHHFPGREAELVEFVVGLAQGCPSRSLLNCLLFT